MIRTSCIHSIRIITWVSVCTIVFRLLYIPGMDGGPEAPRVRMQRSARGRSS